MTISTHDDLGICCSSRLLFSKYWPYTSFTWQHLWKLSLKMSTRKRLKVRPPQRVERWQCRRLQGKSTPGRPSSKPQTCEESFVTICIATQQHSCLTWSRQAWWPRAWGGARWGSWGWSALRRPSRQSALASWSGMPRWTILSFYVGTRETKRCTDVSTDGLSWWVLGGGRFKSTW